MPQAEPAAAPPPKLVVWDLDGTLWQGTLGEDAEVGVFDSARRSVAALDRGGILQSIASRCPRELAWPRLRAEALDRYFLAPQFGVECKAGAIAKIAATLDIDPASILFIDDSGVERAWVESRLPTVRCVDATQRGELATLAEAVVTPESRRRRRLYRAELERRQARAQAAHEPDFLAGLRMHLSIRRARARDLLRAEELTLRTHQGNSTGAPYSRDELGALCASPRHDVLLVDLDDRFGRHGCIGLVLLDRSEPNWRVRLLLTSCRVLPYGVGTLLLHWLIDAARPSGHALLGDYVANERNRAMLVAYRFAGFRIRSQVGDRFELEHPLTSAPPWPTHVKLTAPDLLQASPRPRARRPYAVVERLA